MVEDRITGLLVPPDDLHALTASLIRLLSDSQLRRSMGQAGREKMRREFSVDSMIKRMSQVYENRLVAKGLVNVPDSVPQ